MEESSVLSGLVARCGRSSGYIPWLNRTPNSIHRICTTRISGARSCDSNKLHFSRFLLVFYFFTLSLPLTIQISSFSLGF